MPVDQMSERMVYVRPCSRSGCSWKDRQHVPVSTLDGQQTYSHVETRAGERPCVRLHELARHAEIAEFDDAFACQEHVGWLDISVDGLLRVEVGQPLQDLHIRRAISGIISIK